MSADSVLEFDCVAGSLRPVNMLDIEAICKRVEAGIAQSGHGVRAMSALNDLRRLIQRERQDAQILEDVAALAADMEEFDSDG